MDRSLLALVIIVVSIAIFSVPVVRRSKSRGKVYGGGLAQTFHFIAIAAYVGVVPAFLCGSILAGPSNFGFPVGLSLLTIALAALLAYAIAERPARATLPKEDRGWTEEDARRSGL
jgi:hypothetical protein